MDREPGRLQSMGSQRVQRDRATITTILEYSLPVGQVFGGEGEWKAILTCQAGNL